MGAGRALSNQCSMRAINRALHQPCQPLWEGREGGRDRAVMAVEGTSTHRVNVGISLVSVEGWRPGCAKRHHLLPNIAQRSRSIL